ncbi:MAG TPA: type II secretion system protein N [Cellvibrionaceae bacterium]
MRLPIPLSICLERERLFAMSSEIFLAFGALSPIQLKPGQRGCVLIQFSPIFYASPAVMIQFLEILLAILESKWAKPFVITVVGFILVVHFIRGYSFSSSKSRTLVNSVFTPAFSPLIYSYVDAANAHLMGVAPVKIVETKPIQEVVAPTPITHLALLGTITDADPKLASAFISVSGQNSKRFFVGKKISDDIKLVAVDRDFITIERAEKLELLYFPNGNAKPLILSPNKRQIQQMNQNTSEIPERSDLFNPGMEALEQLRRNLGTQ